MRLFAGAGVPVISGLKELPGPVVVFDHSSTRGLRVPAGARPFDGIDADPEVIGVVSQPFWIHWKDGKRHAPDYFVRLADGSAVVVDVRADDRISDADAELFDRSREACVSVGWEYRHLGVLDPVMAANLRWLSGYRHPRAHRAGIAAALEATFGCTRPLMAGVRSVGQAIMVLPVLFHMLWHERLVVDLASGVLGEYTMVGPAAPR